MPTSSTSTTVIAQPKNFLKSKTIWGGITMLASALAPLASTFLGIDINADDVNTGVSLVADAVQGITAAAGFILVMIGRFQKKVSPVVLGSGTEKSVVVEVPRATVTATPSR